MLDLKYKIGDVLEDENGQLWVVVYFDEETNLYNIQKIDVKQVSEFELNKYILIEEDELNG